MTSCCDVTGGVPKNISATYICGSVGSICRLSSNSITTNNLFVNNIFNQDGEPLPCSAYPLSVDSSQCTSISPGFCGSILQYVDAEWGIYRSPGMTEITVGDGGNGVAPGNNFFTVSSALTDGTSFSNCRFIRITDDVVENGPVTVPDNTLIYIDPGVTWTLVGGGIVTQGDFVLLGNQSSASSTISFQSLAGGTAFSGPGSLEVRHLHIDRTVDVIDSEYLYPSSKPLHMTNCRITLGNAGYLITEDSKSSGIVDTVMTDVTIEGNPGDAPFQCMNLFNQQNPYRFKATNLTFQGDWSSTDDIISISTSFNQIYGVVFNTSGTIRCSLGGQYTSIVNANTNVIVTLRLIGADSTYVNIKSVTSVNILNTNIHLTNVMCENLNLSGSLNCTVTNCTTTTFLLSNSNNNRLKGFLISSAGSLTNSSNNTFETFDVAGTVTYDTNSINNIFNGGHTGKFFIEGSNNTFDNIVSFTTFTINQGAQFVRLNNSYVNQISWSGSDGTISNCHCETSCSLGLALSSPRVTLSNCHIGKNGLSGSDLDVNFNAGVTLVNCIVGITGSPLVGIVNTNDVVAPPNLSATTLITNCKQTAPLPVGVSNWVNCSPL